MLCPNCGRLMKSTMHFDNNRNYKFLRCDKCFYSTKPKRLHLEETIEREKNECRKRDTK